MRGYFSRNDRFGDVVASMRKKAAVDPSQDDLLVFICSGVEVACEPVGIVGRFHGK